MSFLYDFIYKFREYILLVLAVLVSFVLMFSNDNPQVNAFRAEAVDFFAFVQEPLLKIERLNELQVENTRLHQRVVELSIQLQQRREAMLENQRLRKLLRFQNESKLKIKPAKIINLGTSSLVNSATINLGAADGIHKNQAVVVSEGVVGKIIEAGDKASIVQLLTDVNFRLSVKTQRTRANGILLWQHDNICTMDNVPKTLDVQVGDTVITSGYSDIFPEGLQVGQVITASNEIPGYHKRIQVRTSANFNELEEVFVVVKRPEVDSLATKS
ncbi:MAG: rod shape-determining protein MreC [Candidatus Marinimicrobia bacterium]|nr:rod shape-determining protein MreC [Candidatus Neomarinimicrobiota bacterium]MCF7827682.1 rod shape-determining protein MreC [Candidatus Neomarinimicrobiota bacterium]MCF7881263.1 rod shape-determining protein MreC [Candidatus Neomarinimicrobiota bacterium]